MSLLQRVTKTAPVLPSRVYFYASEKFGKTSWACHAPDPIFIMTEGETGLLSLIEAGQVPETAHWPEDCKTWNQLLDVIRAVRDEQHTYRSLVLDTANGAERMLAQHVCNTEFDGKITGKEGYGSYGKGDLACIPHWVELLRLFDDIRIKRRMSIILLAHARVKAVNNPEGDDYDQVRPEGVDKLWTLTHKWSDVIAAGTWRVKVYDDKVKTAERVIRTSGSIAVVAGNRYSLPPEIPCGKSAKEAFGNFARALGAAKAAGKKTPPAGDQPPPSGGGNKPVDPAPAPQAPPVQVQAPAPEPAPAAPPVEEREPGMDDFDEGVGEENDGGETPAGMLPAEATRIRQIQEAMREEPKISPADADLLLGLMRDCDVNWRALQARLNALTGRIGVAWIKAMPDIPAGDVPVIRKHLEGLVAAKNGRKRKPVTVP